jgi:hypothetical protein
MISRTLATLALVSSCFMICAQTELTKEQRKKMNAVINKHIQYLGGSSIAACVTGFLLKNDALLGLGIGGSIGTTCYIFEDKSLWPISWLAAYIARRQLVSILHTTKAKDVVLTKEENSDVKALTRFFSSPYQSEQQTREIENQFIESAKDGKKSETAVNFSMAGSWTAYLWLRFIARQAEQEARIS